MSNVVFRTVIAEDADGISAVLQDIAAAGKRTRPSDVGFARAQYVAHPDKIRCTVAVDANNRLLGFQSLIKAQENNPYEVTVGWAVIGTHIRPTAARLGVGRGLFAQSLVAARASGVPAIDATIAADNAEGLAYYHAMGFVDYRQLAGAVSKKYSVR
jgi:L-amino acid N-acyltransferase YncA